MEKCCDSKYMEVGIEKFGYNQELKRVLGLRDLIILGLSMGVPISVATVYGYIVGASYGSISLVYLVTAIAMLFTGNSYARLSQDFPLAGGAYAFVSRGISKWIGFFTGWAMVGMYLVLLPLVYIFCAYALYAILPDVPLYAWMIFAIILNTIINYRGMEVTGEVLKYIFFIGMIMYGWFIVAGIIAVVKNADGAVFTMAPFYNNAGFSLESVMVGVSIAIFNFGGPDALTTLGEETKGGAKVLGQGVLLTFASLGALYILLTYVAGMVWPGYGTFGNPDTAFYEIALRAGGPVLKLAFVLTLVLTLVGCAICIQACSSRALYAMARDRMLPAIFSKIHPTYNSPFVGIIAISFISVIICLSFANQAEILTSIVNFNMLFCWFSVNITAIYYYMKKKKSSHYMRDLVFPVLGAVVVGYVFVCLNPSARIAGMSWLAIGVVFFIYLHFIKKVDISFSSESGV